MKDDLGKTQELSRCFTSVLSADADVNPGGKGRMGNRDEGSDVEIAKTS